MEIYSLPQLSFEYKELEPYLSEGQLRVHHQKHHQAYVNGANAIFQKLEDSRKTNSEIDVKAVLKELSFHIGGHILHSLFWKNLAPKEKAGKMSEKLKNAIENEFGSFERFKSEFSKAALSVEGSGWAALVLEKTSKRLLIMQIEKHNLNIYPNSEILLVLDLWEHAYYLDYKNDRAKFIESFWNIINWKEVNNRFK